jgi:hypothetical protein
MLKQTEIDFNSFHNTVGFVGGDLQAEEIKAKSLEEFILLNVFRHITDAYSPYDVMEVCELKGRKTKENSVRRALHNLKSNQSYWFEKHGKALMETGETKVNPKYSKIPNATYRLILK